MQVIDPLERTLDDHLASAPASGAAVVVGTEGTLASSGPIDRPFPLASVTKLFTATAVLVAVAEGTVALETPAGPNGATIAHLLAHASGLGPDGGVLAEPGRRRIYSNAGYEILADVVAQHAGFAFERYATEAVVEGLDLTATTLAGSPAAGAAASAGDVAALAEAWLVPGGILDRRTVTRAIRPFPSALDGVLPGFGSQSPNDWGLGPEIRGHKSPHWTGTRNSPDTFGHFGRSGTLCWVDPAAGVALVWLSEAEFGPWAVEAWPKLADALLDELPA